MRKTRCCVFKGVEAIVFCLTLALMVLVLLQVGGRYLLPMAIAWTEESARIALLWVVMLGAAAALDRREHYAITIISDRFRPPVDRLVLLAANLAGLVFLVMFSIYGYKYAQSGMRQQFISLGLARGWVYASLPIGGTLMAYSLISQSIEMLLTRGDIRIRAAETE